MAIVSRGYFGTMTMADNGANQITKTWQMTAADAATAATDWAVIKAAFNAICDSVEVASSLGERFENDDITYPAAGVNNQDKASITVRLATGNKKANLKIPAPVIGIFSAATGPAADIVDILDADLNTYLDIFESGGEAYLSDGELMDDPLHGKRISAKHSGRTP